MFAWNRFWLIISPLFMAISFYLNSQIPRTDNFYIPTDQDIFHENMVLSWLQISSLTKQFLSRQAYHSLEVSIPILLLLCDFFHPRLFRLFHTLHPLRSTHALASLLNSFVCFLASPSKIKEVSHESLILNDPIPDHSDPLLRPLWNRPQCSIQLPSCLNTPHRRNCSFR